jgi:hypothetical protein
MQVFPLELNLEVKALLPNPLVHQNCRRSISVVIFVTNFKTTFKLWGKQNKEIQSMQIKQQHNPKQVSFSSA